MQPLAKIRAMPEHEIRRVFIGLMKLYRYHEVVYQMAFNAGECTQYLFGLKNAIYFTMIIFRNDYNSTLASALNTLHSYQVHIGSRVLSDDPDDVSDRERLQGMMEGYRIAAHYLRGYSQY